MKALGRTLFAIVVTIASASTATAQIQSWDKQLGAGRFKVLGQFNNEAVLDQETGLVWERTPSSLQFPWAPYNFGLPNQGTAHIACDIKIVGRRLGWRLPTIQELASLVDPTQSTSLPAGHPFILTTDQQTGRFWSATVASTDPITSPNSAWLLDLAVPAANEDVVYNSQSVFYYTWCVRSGSGVDAQ